MKQKNYIITLAAISLMSCSNDCKQKPQESCATKKEDMEVLLNIKRRLLPEQVSAFRNSFEKCKVHTLEKEKGCLLYEAYQSYTDTCVFIIAERWTNKDAHKLHMTLDHVKVHMTEINGFGDKNYKGSFTEVYICPEANKAE